MSMKSVHDPALAVSEELVVGVVDKAGTLPDVDPNPLPNPLPRLPPEERLVGIAAPDPDLETSPVGPKEGKLGILSPGKAGRCGRAVAAAKVKNKSE